MLTKEEMERFLAFCARRELDPIEQAFKEKPFGVPCTFCMITRVNEMAEDGNKQAKQAIEIVKDRIVHGGRGNKPLDS